MNILQNSVRLQPVCNVPSSRLYQTGQEQETLDLVCICALIINLLYTSIYGAHFRILFGSNNLYVMHHPADYAKQTKSKKPPVDKPTYETAQEEIAKNSGLAKLAGTGKSKGEGEI